MGWTADTKEALRQAVIAAAVEGRTVTYGELARHLGLPVRGPHWKALLDDMSLNRPADSPDLSVLVVNKSTGLPGQVEYRPIGRPTPELRRRLAAEQAAVFAFYRSLRSAG